MIQSTIIVSPRERYSSIISSLNSIFETVDKEVPIIVVEGGSSAFVKDEIAKLQKKRPFKHISLPYPVKPNEARNIGAKEVKTDFIVFADNDIEYEPDWLCALEKNAVEHCADAVAPLIFIGPCEQATIHHAGGILHIKENGQNPLLVEKHRFMDVPLTEVEAQLSSDEMIQNDVCEFHCFLMRKTFYDRMGCFDERYVTREQMDLALRCKDMGARVTFEKDSRVTYRANDPFNPVDIQYHLFRWADDWAVQSIEAFQDTWGVKLESDRIRFRWIRKHRESAIATVYPWVGKIGGKFFHRLFSNMLGKKIKFQCDAQRSTLGEPSVPHLPKARASALLNLE